MYGERQLQLLSRAAAFAVVLGSATGSARECALPTADTAVVHARAEAELEFRPGPGFFVVAGSTAAANAACVSQKVANTALVDLVERADAALGLDPQIAVLFSAAPLACGNVFYVPVANDVRGIGYEHEDAREVFDDSPTSRLEGVVFLNDFPYWQAHADEFRRDFIHELGHRFAARVHARGLDATLLGREAQHWSYFLDTAGSPLEGNVWTTSDAAHFVADTPLAPVAFSELDLYLMGSLPAEAVNPKPLLATTTAATDCLGHALTASSPPQSCGALAFEGTVSDVTVEAVIAEEGERDPAPAATPRTLDVAMFVLSNGTDFSRGECEALAATLPERVAEFATATRGSLSIAPLADPNGSCELASEEPPAAPNGAHDAMGGCELPRGDRSARCGWCAVFLLLLCARRHAQRGAR